MAVLTGTLLNGQGAPVTDPFSITLYDFGVVQADNSIYLGHTWEVFPDINGEFSVELWNNLEADNSANYLVEHGNGVNYYLKLPAGVVTGSFTDYVDFEGVSTPGVLTRLKDLEDSSPLVLIPRIESIELVNTDQDTNIPNLQTTLDVLDLAVQDHDVTLGLIPSLQTSISSLDGRVGVNEATLDTVPGAITSLAGQVGGLQSSVGDKAEQTQVDDIDNRLISTELAVELIPGINGLAISNLVEIQVLNGNISLLDTTLSGAIADNSAQISSNSSQIITNATNITSKANQSSLDTLSTQFASHSHPVISSPFNVEGSTDSQLILTQSSSSYPDYRLRVSDRNVSIQADDNSDGTYDDLTVLALDRDTEMAQMFGHESWHNGNKPSESGSFNPYPQGENWGYTSSGVYHRWGLFVWMRFTLEITTVGTNTGVNIFQIEGLPYDANGQDYCCARFTNLSGMPSNGYHQVVFLGGDRIRPQYIDGTSATFKNYLLTQIIPGSEIRLGAVYTI